MQKSIHKEPSWTTKPDHAQTVQLFGKYALTGKDPDVKAFAQQILPALKDHLAAIKAIDKSMQDTASK